MSGTVPKTKLSQNATCHLVLVKITVTLAVIVHYFYSASKPDFVITNNIDVCLMSVLRGLIFVPKF